MFRTSTASPYYFNRGWLYKNMHNSITPRFIMNVIINPCPWNIHSRQISRIPTVASGQPQIQTGGGGLTSDGSMERCACGWRSTIGTGNMWYDLLCVWVCWLTNRLLNESMGMRCLQMILRKACHQGPFLLNGLTLISVCMNNYIFGKLGDEITYTFPNFNGKTVEVWEG